MYVHAGKESGIVDFGAWSECHCSEWQAGATARGEQATQVCVYTCKLLVCVCVCASYDIQFCVCACYHKNSFKRIGD